MKRALFVVAIVLVCAAQVWAQFDLRPYIGPQVDLIRFQPTSTENALSSHGSASNTYEHPGSSGMIGGVFAGFGSASNKLRWLLGVGAHYQDLSFAYKQQVSSYSPGGGYSSTREGTLQARSLAVELPMLASIRLADRVALLAGTIPAALVQVRSRDTGVERTSSYIYTQGLQSSTVTYDRINSDLAPYSRYGASVAAGASILILGRIHLDLLSLYNPFPIYKDKEPRTAYRISFRGTVSVRLFRNAPAS